MIQEVPAAEWRPFLERFSREHRAWLATVHVVDARGGTVSRSAQIPLESAAASADGLRLELRDAHALCVHNPRALRIQRTGIGLVRALEIDGPDGRLIRLAFRATAAPEQLDGLAPGELPADRTYSVGKGNFTVQGPAKHRLRAGQTAFQVGIAFADTAGVDRAEETMATVSESPAKAVKEYLEPVRAAVEENIREVRRAVVAGRHAVEDRAAEATIQVRRHPFMSLGVAVCVGTLFGCVIGFGVARFGARRPG